MSTITSVTNTLLDLIAPPRCMRCLIEGSYLCDACRKTIRFSYPQACVICEHHHPQGLTCSECRSESVLAGVVSYGGYETPWLRRGIHWLKFRGIKEAAPALANLLIPPLLLIAPLPQLIQQAALVSIPLHPRRQRERGFNQSTEIIKSLSHQTGIAASDILVRTKATWAQAKLPKELRSANTNQAFEQIDTLPPETRIVIVVDDVTTTGSTLTAAASVINHDLPISIWGLTVARG